MCTWAEFRAVLKCDGVPPVYGSCHSLVPEILTLGEETFFSVFFNLAHPTVYFSVPCAGEHQSLWMLSLWPVLLGRLDICHLQFGSLGGQLGLAGDCQSSGGLYISHGLPVFQSCAVWPRSGC